MIALSSTPFAYLIAGPLADHVFEPVLRHDGALAPTLGRLIGTGRGRGIGLMLIGLGILTILTVIVGYLYPRIRLVEDELPDAITNIPITPAATTVPAVAGVHSTP